MSTAAPTIDPKVLDDLIMTYAKAADGVGCERGSFLYDEISRGLTAVLLRMKLWNPMGDAPLDGTPVLLAAGGTVAEGQYHPDAQGWWLANSDPSDHWNGRVFPEAWMSMPMPPFVDPADRR